MFNLFIVSYKKILKRNKKKVDIIIKKIIKIIFINQILTYG